MQEHKALAEVRMGFPRKVISDCAKELQADLIMVGSHGHSAIGRFLLGSVAQAVLRIAPCPVEIVRIPAGDAAPSSHPMKVLLATDGSGFSLAAAISVANRPWPDGTVFKVIGVEELVALEAPMAASPVASVYPANLLEELLAEAHTRAVNAVESTRKILQEARLSVLEQAPDSQRAIPARSFWLWLRLGRPISSYSVPTAAVVGTASSWVASRKVLRCAPTARWKSSGRKVWRRIEGP